MSVDLKSKLYCHCLVLIFVVWDSELRCQGISIWPEQRLPAATVNPRRGGGHPDTLPSSCTSSSTTQKLWTTKYVTFNKQKYGKPFIYSHPSPSCSTNLLSRGSEQLYSQTCWCFSWYHFKNMNTISKKLHKNYIMVFPVCRISK